MIISFGLFFSDKLEVWTRSILVTGPMTVHLPPHYKPKIWSAVHVIHVSVVVFWEINCNAITIQHLLTKEQPLLITSEAFPVCGVSLKFSQRATLDGHFISFDGILNCIWLTSTRSNEELFLFLFHNEVVSSICVLKIIGVVVLNMVLSWKKLNHKITLR